MPAAAISTPVVQPKAGSPGSGGFDAGGRGDHGGPKGSARRETHRMGMWFGLASVTMLFLGLTSAYLVREGLGAGWTQFQMPPLLLLNTAFLLASSLALERSRRTLRAAASAAPGSFSKWTAVALALGLLFLAGQLIAWRQLAERGIYLSSNPSSSFFYTLTGVHGLHLLGGVIALCYLAARSGGLELATLRRRAEATAIYWHFMDGLWLYLFVLLFVWK